MVESPYNKGDTISLNQEYEILKLVSETEKYWLYEAVQFDVLKKVKVIVYNNTNFSSSIEVEIEWKSDVEVIQKEAVFNNEKVEFIESGVKMDGGKLQYVIVYGSVEAEVDIKPTTQPTIGASRPIPATPKSPVDLRAEKESVAAPQKTFLAEIDNLGEVAHDRPVPEKAKEVTVEEALAETEAEGHADEEIVEEIKEMLDDDEDSVKVDEMDVVPAHPNEIDKGPSSPPPEKAASPSTGTMKSKVFGKEPAKKESIPEKMEDIPTTSSIAPVEDEFVDEIREESLRSIEVEEEKDYVKFIAMDYFDRMNPSNYYPLKLKISDVKKTASVKMVNPITGERKVTERDEMEATLIDPIVTVRPVILGCSVMPEEIETNFDDEEDELTFYVTPGVKGKVIGSIDFINENEVIHSTKFEAKVVDPNYARVVAFYGILTSFTPKIIGFLGLNIGLEQTMNELWGVTSSVFMNMSLAGLIAIGGLVPVIILSLIVRWKLKPSEGKLKFNLTNFRLKDLKIKKSKA